jgi:hypothetical protein
MIKNKFKVYYVTPKLIGPHNLKLNVMKSSIGTI